MEKEPFYQRNAKTNESENRWKRFWWSLVQQYLFRPSPKYLQGWRRFLLRCFGAKIGWKSSISPTTIIYRPWDLVMGNHSSIEENCQITCPVIIGDYVAIAQKCDLIAGGHDVKSRGQEVTFAPIVIGDSAFIGIGCYIAAGVKIGTASVIAAHMNIYKSIPANKIVVPEPVRTIKVDRIPPEDFDNYYYNFTEQCKNSKY